MTKDLNPKAHSKTVSRRRFIAGAAGVLAMPHLASAQSAVDALINTPGRGTWDDQFDAVTSRAQASVSSNQPILGPNAPSNLMQAIAEYQRIVTSGGWPQVHPNVPLQFGVYDPSVQQLRQRLIVSGDLPSSAGISDSYDSYVQGAVRRFQARHGLAETGYIDEYTLKALNVSARVRLAQLETNLTRVEDTGSDLGERYVLVNIPAAYAEAVENNAVALRNVAIVGRPSRQTPLLNSKIFEIIFNPPWTVPRSIIQKDIMPLMREDPNYLVDNKIRLYDNKGNEVDPMTIDWNAEKAPNLTFRQDPGPNSAMASTKINFHNKYAVYMHDTPSQSLFNEIVRFESSGCVRIENVRDLDVWLLKNTPGWNRQKIEETIRAGISTPVNLADPVPNHFVYITAWSAKDGVVQFRDDIYNLDGAPELALQTTSGIE
ncbi:UNVERIFIED_ORG: murein L,D-transpeptidase YcbB/YkuD [Martelella mediterranea]|uniref:Murein L,D-transpeptidase YcbB/YkuD n=1 Tax=Martelella mangrovi TaxID=1397477 RepID=A0ABV2IBX9_9HYPH|nr:L,D-transpeptidase family protein [uncultured Martelella sp.]